MRVLVCGGRDFSDFDAANEALTYHAFEADFIIHGGARGADSLAQDWADNAGLACLVYPADWKMHGRAAGPLRNQRMIDEGKPDLVIAFPGSRGTADMIRRAKAAGIPVKEIS